MSSEKDIKTILSNLEYPDDAQVVKQITAQGAQVRSRMSQIRRKILVLSGKGGVGKSMTTVNLALAFARKGLGVGLLDVDLNGPCVPRMLGMKGGHFTLTSAGAIPPVGPLGIKVASMEFFLNREDSPIRWKGPTELSPVWLGMMELSVLREFLGDIVWGELDYLFADLPPGAAADKPPAIAGFIPELDGAVVVTTPSEVAQSVVRKSIVYARDVGIPIIGLVENMSGALCPHCGTEVPLFQGDSYGMSADLDVPVLGKVPFDRQLNQASDRGEPILDEKNPIAVRYSEIAEKIISQLDFKRLLAEKDRKSVV